MKSELSYFDVAQFVESLRLTQKTVNFPGSKNDLSGDTYREFIELLLKKFATSGLNVLEIQLFNCAKLKVMSQMTNALSQLPLKKLILNFTDYCDTARDFDQVLSDILCGLNASAVMQIDLVCNNANIFNAETINSLIDKITNHNITIDITLPEQFKNLFPYQGKLDEIISAHAELNSPAIDLQPFVRQTLDTDDNKNNLQPFTKHSGRFKAPFAIEGYGLSKTCVNRQVKVSQQLDLEHNIPAEDEIYSLAQFQAALFNASDVFCEESKVHLIMNRDITTEMWSTWLGYFPILDLTKNEARDWRALRLSKAAIEELMRNRDKFQDGIGVCTSDNTYSNLPAGFKVKQHPELHYSYIDFNAELKQVAPKDWLAVQTSAPQPNALTAIDRVKSWNSAHEARRFVQCWNKCSEHEKYDKEVITALRAALPKIAALPAEIENEIFDLCYDDESATLNLKIFNFLVYDLGSVKGLTGCSESILGITPAIPIKLRALFPQGYSDSTILQKLQKIQNYPGDFNQQNILSKLLNEKELFVYTNLMNIASTLPQVIHEGLWGFYFKTQGLGFEDLAKLISFIANIDDRILANCYSNVLNWLGWDGNACWQIVTRECQEAIQQYAACDAAERRLFEGLCAVHAQYNKNIIFVELMNSFNQFKAELSELMLNVDFAQIQELELATVKSMPLALARVVALMRHVRAQDRLDQLAEAFKLDLSSTGMIKAIAMDVHDKQWHFVTKEMNLSWAYEQERYKIEHKFNALGHRPAVRRRNMPSNWHDEAVFFGRHNWRLNFSDQARRWSAHSWDRWYREFFGHCFVVFPDLTDKIIQVIIEIETKQAISNKAIFRAIFTVCAQTRHYNQKIRDLLLRVFYRYAGFQARNAALGLKVYQFIAHNIIPDNLISGEWSSCADWLRAVTLSVTGAQMIKLLPNQSSAAVIKDLEIIVISEPSYDASKREDFLNNLSALSLRREAFPLSLHNLFVKRLCSSSGKSEKSRTISDAVIIVESFKNLRNFAHDCALNIFQVYRGFLHHYIFFDGQDSTILQNHCSVFHTIRQLMRRDDIIIERRSEVQSSLVSLISAFNITRDECENLLRKIALGSKNVLAVLRILSEIDLTKYAQAYKNNVQCRLSVGDLSKIIDTVNDAGSNLQFSAIEFVRHYQVRDTFALREYFDSRYIQLYGTARIDSSVSYSIKKAFAQVELQELVEQIIVNVNNVSDPPQYINLVGALQDVCDQLSNYHEKKTFLTQLAQAEALYCNQMPLISVDNTFTQLLVALNNQQKIDELVTFLIGAQKLSPQRQARINKNFAEKTLFLIKEIYPCFRYPGQLIVAPEIAALVHHVLLLTDSDHHGLTLDYYQVLVNNINAIIAHCPAIKKQLIKLLDNFWVHDSAANAVRFEQFVQLLHKYFGWISDPTDLLALCAYFNRATQDHGPSALFALFEQIATISDEAQPALLIALLSKLVSNNIYDDATYRELVAIRLHTNQALLLQVIAAVYAKPPYPTLASLFAKLDDRSCGDDQIQQVVEFFECNSYYRAKNNDFDYHKYSHKIKQLACANPLSDDLLNNFKTYLHEMKSIISSELLEKFNSSHVRLEKIAIAAELLYRITGEELNTGQYLAILVFLVSGEKKIISQIDTGEGKLGIMAIVAVICWNAGCTVDFITGDLLLATRDYLYYQSYFKMLGIPTGIIFADSDLAQYKFKGINFSDLTNMSFFRTKAYSLFKETRLLDDSSEKRVLLLDEADVTLFDKDYTEFNFVEPDVHAPPHQMYEKGIKYFVQNAHKPTAINLPGFRSAIGEKIASLSSEAQLQQWYQAAIVSCNLEFNKDYIIDADQLIALADGYKTSSQAKVLNHNRVVENALYTAGVHQFLHALLNVLMQDLGSDAQYPGLEAFIANCPKELIHKLKGCSSGFWIADEKQIACSRNAINFFTSYDHGHVIGKTGTVISELERLEARERHGIKFIDVPRMLDNKSADLAPELFKNDHARKAKFSELSLNSQNITKQPILFLTSNGQESEELFQFLYQTPGIQQDLLQHIAIDLSVEERQERLNKAGKDGWITVATDVFGSAVDYNLSGNTVCKHGMLVIVTYITSQRALSRILGCAGRFGAIDKVVLMVLTADLETALNSKLPRTWQKNVGELIQIAQSSIERRDQIHRSNFSQGETVLANVALEQKIFDNFYYTIRCVLGCITVVLTLFVAYHVMLLILPSTMFLSAVAIPPVLTGVAAVVIGAGVFIGLGLVVGAILDSLYPPVAINKIVSPTAEHEGSVRPTTP